MCAIGSVGWSNIFLWEKIFWVPKDVLEKNFDSRAGGELPASHMYPKELMLFLCHDTEVVHDGYESVKSWALRRERCWVEKKFSWKHPQRQQYRNWTSHSEQHSRHSDLGLYFCLEDSGGWQSGGASRGSLPVVAVPLNPRFRQSYFFLCIDPFIFSRYYY